MQQIPFTTVVGKHVPKIMANNNKHHGGAMMIKPNNHHFICQSWIEDQQRQQVEATSRATPVDPMEMPVQFQSSTNESSLSSLTHRPSGK